MSGMKKIDRRRFNTYLGNIGEVAVDEYLRANGFQTWLVRPLHIGEEIAGQRVGYLWLFHPNRFRKLNGSIGEVEFDKEEVKVVERFFEHKTSDLKKYMEKILSLSEYQYLPDLFAKKDGNFYVVEVKTNSGMKSLKGRKLRGLLLAKEYGFVPMVVTLNADVKVGHFGIHTLNEVK